MEDLFETLKNVKNLSEDEAKDTVASIVEILKNANITYDCAHEILRITARTLSKMQGAISL